MERHSFPLHSTPHYSQDFDNVVTSLQNLDLKVSYNQESSSRNLDHGVFDGSLYSAFSPQLQYVDWSNTVHRPQLLDHASHWGQHGSGGNSFLFLCVCVCVCDHAGTFMCLFMLYVLFFCVFEIFLKL